MNVELKIREEDNIIKTYSINDVDYVKVIKFGSLVEISTTTDEISINLLDDNDNVVDTNIGYQIFGKYVYIEESKLFIVRSIIDELYIYSESTNEPIDPEPVEP